MREKLEDGKKIVILSTFKFANQVLITFLTLRHSMYAMPGFNQTQQKLELIFLRFFFYLRYSCRINPRWGISY